MKDEGKSPREKRKKPKQHEGTHETNGQAAGDIPIETQTLKMNPQP